MLHRKAGSVPAGRSHRTNCLSMALQAGLTWFSGPMIISIGDITARCPRCQGSEFEALTAGPLRLASELECSGCGERVRYLALLDQIGEEAMRRANEAIDALKKKKK